MRVRGKKQSAAYRQHEAERNAFLVEFGSVCAVCGAWRSTSVHEITPGRNRMRAFGVRAAWLPTCAVCNCGRLMDKIEWPLARQLALKLIVDPEYFCLLSVRKIFAPEGTHELFLPVVVTEADVLGQVKQLLTERRGG